MRTDPLHRLGSDSDALALRLSQMSSDGGAAAQGLGGVLPLSATYGMRLLGGIQLDTGGAAGRRSHYRNGGGGSELVSYDGYGGSGLNGGDATSRARALVDSTGIYIYIYP